MSQRLPTGGSKREGRFCSALLEQRLHQPVQDRESTQHLVPDYSNRGRAPEDPVPVRGEKKKLIPLLFVALLHGSDLGTDPPSPRPGLHHAVAVRHPHQGHGIEDLARQLHLHPLSAEGPTSHTSTDDRFVSEDRIFDHGPPAVA